ncbi:uncharacterized protein LOC124277067 [Haliotis rubra]|uniref:uncharacterized protein LOC124277067 n=1 Tax=Haliotis rubra TaxID=36100 RepID=UPI001EE4FECB|nr:uncharacterized protein LOC124277067 [Haliotis rubra]
MEEISSFRPVRPGNAKDFEQFADMLDVVVVNMRDSDRFEELGIDWDDVLDHDVKNEASQWLTERNQMASRRGLPKEILSDNGTNFIGAANELKQLVAQLDTDKVKTSLANRGVIWKLNPPHAPNFGGVFESMIKAAKRAIYAILGSGDITDEELVTAFSDEEVEKSTGTCASCLEALDEGVVAIITDKKEMVFTQP